MGSDTHARQDTSPAEDDHGRTITPPVSGPATAVNSPAQDAPQDPGPSQAHQEQEGNRKKPKKKKNRNRNRRRRDRHPSFLGPEDSDSHPVAAEGAEPDSDRHERPPFYRSRRRSLSSTSLESEALLDHRNQPEMRPRRDSRLAQSVRPESFVRSGSYIEGPLSRRSTWRQQRDDDEQDEAEQEVTDRTPLVTSYNEPTSPSRRTYGTDSWSSPYTSRGWKQVNDTSSSRLSVSSRRSPQAQDRDYDINYPPSVPGSPKPGEIGYDDAVVTGADFPQGTRSPSLRRGSVDRLREAIIDVEGGGDEEVSPRSRRPSSPRAQMQDTLQRRRTISLPVEEDVCFPTDLTAELLPSPSRDGEMRRRRRRHQWPDLSVLEEWTRQEKEDRGLEYRVKKISEPVLVGGRLRPQYAPWHQVKEDAPYRFTYFNEDFQSTIHAQTISELVQPGGSFRELFMPEPLELEDSTSEDEGDDLISLHDPTSNSHSNNASRSRSCDSKEDSNSHRSSPMPGRSHSEEESHTQHADYMSRSASQQQSSKRKKIGPRPTWWLDVLSPSDAEMRVLAKTFGIHALTAEDIMMQEAREKVELFRHYYFLNYRTFEQDPDSENYLQPVNMYVVVFREGCLSFHFSPTPHPANVRRRIRQLRDYLLLSSDWICYALIDDITDVFGPLIQSIENEVDEVDDTIMRMHMLEEEAGVDNPPHKDRVATPSGALAPGEMLRRVGECRKKVMGMYRLLSTKADVIKGFAKRCNEQWEVAPKSEIGLYLGDIQDHIMTMTSNLAHYETLLSRAHSNYLAQLNIIMNERQERTADVLGKLTVLGTIVLPMNIICGMWGMNVKVPGQEVDNLHWFWSITGGLVIFGVVSFMIAKRVYRIV